MGFLPIYLLSVFGGAANPCSVTEERIGMVRAWEDRNGRTIRAFLKGVDETEAILVKEGKEYRFPISRLSEADRLYVKEWMESRLLKQVDAAIAKPFPYLSDEELKTAPFLSLELVEKTVFDLTNHERKNRGIKPLREYEELSSIARAHSKDMCSRGFFSHQNPDGDDPTQRARKAEFSGLSKNAEENRVPVCRKISQGWGVIRPFGNPRGMKRSWAEKSDGKAKSFWPAKSFRV